MTKEELIAKLFAREVDRFLGPLPGRIAQTAEEYSVRGMGKGGGYAQAVYEIVSSGLRDLTLKRVEIKKEVWRQRGERPSRDIEPACKEAVTSAIEEIAPRLFEFMAGECHKLGYTDLLTQKKEEFEAAKRNFITEASCDIDIWIAQAAIESVGWLFTEREKKPEELDAVTQLYLKGIFNQELPVAVSSSQSQGYPLCCLMIDLDDFKQINDNHGHPKGDEVLQRVANELQVAVRGKGRAYKYGGDEFVALLWNHAATEGKAVAERIGQAVKTIQIEGMDQGITVSIGVATHLDTSPELVECADRALRRAKQEGKGRVQVYLSPRLEADMQARPLASE